MLGHNVKLGRGGIREIEFFAQTQQLIFGGRNPALRGCAAPARRCARWPPPATSRRSAADELIEAYGFLRQVEHRLQMVDDRQTHSLPNDEAGVAAIATFLGYADSQSFQKDLLDRLHCVEGHYARLFEEAPSLAGPGGNLVFTGTDDDPGTLETLRDAGLPRSLGGGRHRAALASRPLPRDGARARARELLTELMPGLLKALGATAAPDQALLNFDLFLGNLPAGIQLFSLFKANPGAARAGRGDHGQRAGPGRPSGAPHPSCSMRCCRPPSTGRCRRRRRWRPTSRRNWPRSSTSRTSSTWRGAGPTTGASRSACSSSRRSCGRPRRALAYSDIAAATISALCDRVEQRFAETHGGFRGQRLAVLGMGKLGSREMSATSDLDLIFVYDIPPGLEASDGRQPLAPIQYYTRLSAKIVTALTAHTNEGALYEVDMRLRPSGRAGPLANSLEGFESYHAQSAWTWEHMALTRARVIHGPAGPGRAAGRHRQEHALPAARSAALVRDVADMRDRIARHAPAKSPWDFKHLPGGLFDIDFVAQYLALRHAAERPDLLDPHPAEMLRRAADGRPARRRADAERLRAARTLLSDVQSLLRLTLNGDEAAFDETKAPEGQRV